MANSFIRDYRASLKDLTFNSKPLINTLTMLADESREYADEICLAIEERLRKASVSCSFAVLLMSWFLRVCTVCERKPGTSKCETANSVPHGFNCQEPWWCLQGKVRRQLAPNLRCRLSTGKCGAMLPQQSQLDGGAIPFLSPHPSSSWKLPISQSLVDNLYSISWFACEQLPPYSHQCGDSCSFSSFFCNLFCFDFVFILSTFPVPMARWKNNNKKKKKEKSEKGVSFFLVVLFVRVLWGWGFVAWRPCGLEANWRVSRFALVVVLVFHFFLYILPFFFSPFTGKGACCWAMLIVDIFWLCFARSLLGDIVMGHLLLFDCVVVMHLLFRC